MLIVNQQDATVCSQFYFSCKVTLHVSGVVEWSGSKIKLTANSCIWYIHAYIIIIIITTTTINSFYSLWSTWHPWTASMHCDLQLSPWPRSMIFLCFLLHPLLSFATFSSAYLFFYIPEDSNLMRFSVLFLLLYVMCVQSNSSFFFFYVAYTRKWKVPREY